MELLTGRSAEAHGYIPRPPEPRIVGFNEAVRALLPEYQRLRERATEIDEEVRIREEALLRARQARADAAFSRQLGISADVAAEAWLRGETPEAPPPDLERIAVLSNAPTEEVLLGLSRRIDALKQERGTITGRVSAMRRELVVALGHDAADAYVLATDDLMRQYALLTEAGLITGTQTLGLGAFRLEVPGLGDKFRHGAQEVQGLLSSPEIYRSAGGFARARESIERALSDFRSI